ncbi:hypothetical protein IWQ62_000919 [Dispira parvispora]|uniref:C2H2-type domain-containing protein n=1 Tax=Dispira parvispora TaxID=1520584 RepID=A0A9W8AZ71_9FUNG|nr:hypothetical protein IWQ62_000919 [Dispira parvispora]
MNTHTGERPHACTWPGCEQRFSVLSNLRRHMRSRHQSGTAFLPYSRHPTSRYIGQGTGQFRQASQSFRPLQLSPPHMVHPYAQIHTPLSPAEAQLAHAGLYPASPQYFDGGQPDFVMMPNPSGFDSFTSWIPQTPTAMGSGVSSSGMAVPPADRANATSYQNTMDTTGSATFWNWNEGGSTHDSTDQDERRPPRVMECRTAPSPSFPQAHLLQRRWSAEPSQTRPPVHHGLSPRVMWHWIPTSNPSSPLPPEFYTGHPSPSPLGLYPHSNLATMPTLASVPMSRTRALVSGSPVYSHSPLTTSIAPSSTANNITATQTFGQSIVTPSPMQEAMVMSAPTDPVIGLNPAPSDGISPSAHSHTMTNPTTDVSIFTSGLVPSGTFSDLAGEPAVDQSDLGEHPL